MTKTTVDTREYINQVFCSRCAIKLVTQGLKVEEIPSKVVAQKVHVSVEVIDPQIEEEEMYHYTGDENYDPHSNLFEQKKKREELNKFLANLEKNKSKNEDVHT